jgi:hypothetical protein
MQRMPFAGTALFVLGLLFVFMGIGGLLLGDSSRPGLADSFGPSEAFFTAIGVSAGWVGWCLWFPVGRGRRKHHDKSRRNR